MLWKVEEIRDQVVPMTNSFLCMVWRSDMGVGGEVCGFV